jgi:hypothetical protein
MLFFFNGKFLPFFDKEIGNILDLKKKENSSRFPNFEG